MTSDGIVLIDKPSGMTSRDVVNYLRSYYHIEKIGHTGTLDPLASGLLVVCLNKGVKMVELLTNHDKKYLVTVKLGIKTDTYDVTGNIIERDKNYHLNKEMLEETLASFVGQYYQEVPIYSSKKIAGKKLYEYARKNILVALPKILVNIYYIKLIDYRDDYFVFETKVSKGTYIRSLVNDIGNKLNIAMTMMELRRLMVDKYDVKDAVKIDAFEEKNIIPLENVFAYPIIDIKDKQTLKEVCNGVKRHEKIKSDFIEYFYQKHLVAIYKNVDNEFVSYQQFNNYYHK